jgi:hypothetical protein
MARCVLHWTHYPLGRGGRGLIVTLSARIPITNSPLKGNGRLVGETATAVQQESRK